MRKVILIVAIAVMAQGCELIFPQDHDKKAQSRQDDRAATDEVAMPHDEAPARIDPARQTVPESNAAAVEPVEGDTRSLAERHRDTVSEATTSYSDGLLGGGSAISSGTARARTGAEPETAVPISGDPSFSCDGTLRRVERMICADAALARRDRIMAESYSAARQGRSRALRASILSAQRAFLEARNACREAACVANAYDRRIDALQRRIDS